MREIWTIAKREYRINIRHWSFWFVTIGVPLFFLIFGLVILGVAAAAAGSMFSNREPAKPVTVGIVDQATLLDWEALNPENFTRTQTNDELTAIIDQFDIPADMRDRLTGMLQEQKLIRAVEYKAYDDVDLAKQDLTDEKIRAVLVLPEDFRESGAADYWARNKDDAIGYRTPSRDIRDALIRERFEVEDVDKVLSPLDLLERRFLNVSTEPEEEEEDDKRDVGEIVQGAIFPIAFMVVMMLTIFTSTDRLLRGLVEEKSNRVIEILLSSVSADQLMAGKVIGLGLLGLTQAGIWGVLWLAPNLIFISFVNINFGLAAIFLAYFLGGYFLIATLILGFGSLGRDLQEANQFTAIFIILAITPMMLITLLIHDPNGLLAKALSYFPLSSPFAVLSRYAGGSITWPEILISLTILFLSCYLTIKISAKVFRAGILMTGKPPSLKALWRALREA